MQFIPYLVFDGNTADAMRFYAGVFDAKLEKMMTFGEMPGCDQMPPGSESRIMHACLSLDQGMLMASDSMPGQPYDGMKNVSVAVSFKDVAKARRVFEAMADGGKINMPLEETFWVELFGSVTDRYGTSWLINGGAERI